MAPYRSIHTRNTTYTNTNIKYKILMGAHKRQGLRNVPGYKMNMKDTTCSH